MTAAARMAHWWRNLSVCRGFVMLSTSIREKAAYSDGDELQLGKLSRPPANHEMQDVLEFFLLGCICSYAQNRVEGVELKGAVVW
jgi:hypothetical protein